MKLKRYLLISVLFMLLLCCIGGIYAASDDMNNTMGEADSIDESVSVEIDEQSISDDDLADDSNSVISAQDVGVDNSTSEANLQANDDENDSALSVQDMNGVDESSSQPKLQSSEKDNLVGVYNSGSVVGIQNNGGTAVLKATPSNSLTALQNLIDNAQGSVVRLTKSYKYVKGDSIKGVSISKSITIMGKNGCNINGMWHSRIFHIAPYCKVTIAGVHFKNGYSRELGAGICLSEGASLTIRNCIFNKNKVYNANGAGIWADHRTKITIHKSKFVNNRAIRVSNLPWEQFKKGLGSAITVNYGSTLKTYNTVFQNNRGHSSTVLVVSYDDDASHLVSSNALVKNCRFIGNVATSHAAFYLDEFGKGSFMNTVFKNNRATKNGPVVMFEASKSVVVSNCKFIKNTAFGGVLTLGEFDSNGLHGNSHVKIMRSTFSYNKAENGGAISSNSAFLTISSSKFTGNSAKKCGGAIYTNEVGSLKIYSSSFYKNRANYGGAICSDIKTAVASNCKFYQNMAVYGGQSVYGDAERSIVVPTPCTAVLPEQTVGYQSQDAVIGELRYTGVNKLIPYGYLKVTAYYDGGQFSYTTVSDATGHFKVFTGKLSRTKYYITISSDDALITMPTLYTSINVV